MTVGFIIDAIAGAAVGWASAEACDGAIVGAKMGTLEGGLAETDYYLMTSPRKIIDRCMQNRGYEIRNGEGKWI